MNERSTLFWSHVKTYEDCPQRFLWAWGWDGVDCGFGPGNKKAKPPSTESQHHPLMGVVIQATLEKMYNEEMWKDPQNLSKNLLKFVPEEWSRLEGKKRFFLDYDQAGMSRADMLEVCKEGVLGYLQTMKAHKLLGPYAKSEVELVGWINKWTAVGGRADFIIRREDTGITILDGKNTLKKMSGVNPDQVRWYALCFLLAYKVMPDRLGFVWFRYPHGSTLGDPTSGDDIPQTGLEWIPFTRDDLKGLAARAVEARLSMRKGNFQATPAPSLCRFCEFESVCPERQAQKRENGEKRAIKRKVEGISEEGFSDLSLD